VRLTILLGAPLLLVGAAGLAFFPARRGAGVLRFAGLALLLVLYGTAVTEHDPGAPLLRGFGLLLLVGAWLWLPRMRAEEAGAAAVAVVAAGLLAVPVAAALDAERPWWDYRDWRWFGSGESITFDWTHSYGPLDWPREGTTLLNVKSERPHYWKVETLDGFDGFRWTRTAQSGPSRELPGLPASLVPHGRAWSYGEFNPRWDDSFRVTVRSLSSELIVGAGITHDVQGAGPVVSSGDGTSYRLSSEPLERGDSYTVRAYAPDPNATQMRGAPEGTPGALLQYTIVGLPRPGESALDSAASSPGAAALREYVQVPLRGSGFRDPRADAELRDSAYGGAYRLARRLTAGEPTAYDAVKAVEGHLRRDFRYNERPPGRAVPLEAFLFEDRIGYCQQFSGAMALLLRMAGIPARVAAGFSPGSLNRDTGEYRVRDLDAHSWVEVWFNGIGWVPFDPTPAAAPASSQSSGLDAVTAAGTGAGEVRDRPDPASPSSGGGGAAPARGGGGSSGVLRALAVVAVLAAAAAGLARWRLLRRRRRPAADVADAQLHELRAALRRLGFAVPPATTLLALERRLGRSVGPAAARYASALRAHRFDPGAPAGPAPAERRALRRELGAGGVLGRLRALRALPPGGPLSRL
jgi:transglutaminase-like putative cysteine protease